MQRSKWFLGICATILLGAFGSGLWSVVFAPSLGFLSKTFLSLVTLGVTAARDSVYADAARGYVEFPSVILQEFLGLAMAGGPLVWLVFELPRRPTRETLEAKERGERVFRWLLLVLCLLGVIIAVQSAKLGYSMRVHSYFRQSLTICRPFIPKHDEDILCSRFARMKNKGDFVALYSELDAIARQSNVEIPKFSPW
jgi:hypothetical protein